MSLLAPVAHAAITISIAEVRGAEAFVKGSDAGRKQEIFWEENYVTTAKGKGHFSFEGALPAGCVPANCFGTLTAGEETIDVPLAFPPDDPPGEPPGEPADELELAVPPAENSHEGDSVRAVGFVADMEAGMYVVSGGADEHLRYWTLDLNLNQQVDHILPNIPYAIDVATDADGSIFALGEGGWNGHAGAPTLSTWQAALPMQLTQLQAEAPPIGFVYSAAVSSDKQWVAATGFYGDIAVYSADTLTLYATTATKKKRTKSLAFSPDGTIVASASTGGIHLWSFPPGCAPGNCELESLISLSHSGSWVFRVAFSPHSTADWVELISGTDSGETKIWVIENLATNPTVTVRTIDSGSVYALAVAPDPVGYRIVVGGNDTLTVYDSSDLSTLFQNADAHNGRVNDVAVSPDSSLIVSGGADGALKLWTLPQPPP
jgi:WD40 repeat protein